MLWVAQQWCGNGCKYQCSAAQISQWVKVWGSGHLSIVPITWVRLVSSSALQSRKWQLIGMSQWCRSALCGHPLPALMDNCTHSAASRHTIAPISYTRPSSRSHIYYSSYNGLKLSVGDWQTNKHINKQMKRQTEGHPHHVKPGFCCRGLISVLTGNTYMLSPVD